jgi:hypothetical protein
MGLELQVIRSHDPPDAIRDVEQIRPAVLAWRDSLSAALADRLTVPLDWDEGAEAPYFTDKPTWDCYSDLLMWGAYDEQPHLQRPKPHISAWSDDPAYRLSSEAGVRTSYSHLYDVALWLPCDFGFVFKTNDVGGNEIVVGSSTVLLRQLQHLNARTWQAGSDTLRRWQKEGGDHGAPLEVGARFAFALFAELADKAVRNGLPMLLDW